MIYVKLFSTHTDYNTFINGENFITPNLSMCKNENECHYTPLTEDEIAAGDDEGYAD